MKISWKHFAMAVITMSAWATGQVSTGTPPFGSFGGGPFDIINLGNLNTHFAIPVLHKAGRGLPFTYDLTYDSSIWYPTVVNGTTQWMPTPNWGWMPNTLAVIGYVSISTTSTSFHGKICSNGQFGSSTTYTTTYAYVDGKQISHPFPGSTYMTVISGGCSSTTYSSTLTATTTDSSGYTIYAPATQVGITVTTRSGIVVATNVYNPNSGSGWYQDTNGNKLTVNANGQYFDTLSSTTPVLTQAGSGTPTSPITYTYAAPGANATYTVNYTQYTVATTFGVSGVAEYGSTSSALVSSIQLPDSSAYQFTYEKTPGSCTPLSNTYQGNCITGRIASVTLPTGGTITYGYTGGKNGIESDGSTSGLTRTLSATVTAPTQSWSYTRAIVTGTAPGPGSTWKTTVVDPNGNNTVINFAEDSTVTDVSILTAATYSFYETQRQVYQGNISSTACSSTTTNNCLLLTTTACYNAIYASCGTSTVGSPITQTDYYAQPAGGKIRLSETLYNPYGLVTEDRKYDFGVTMGSAPSPTYLVRDTFISYDTNLNNQIVDRPSQIYVQDNNGNTLADTTYAYDVTGVTATTGTPQQVSITGSRGNLTSVSSYKNGTAHLLRTFTYYDTGNPNVVTDVNGVQTTYNYSSGPNPYDSSLTASCGNSFSTSTSEPLSLSRSMQWNCKGGIAEQMTDENGNNVSSSYTDPDFWRVASVTDQMNNLTSIAYDGQTSVESTLLFNSQHSVVDSLVTVDGFGRVIFGQGKQGPTATNYDTTETDYNNLGQPNRVTMPYSAAARPSSQNTSAPSLITTYDALGRVLTTTDANGGYASYQYTNNDVLQTVSATQTGSQEFQKQFEYDGLGRLTSVCEISSTLPNAGSCGQSVAQTGYLTQYTYDAVGRLLMAKQNAQPGGTPQTRTFAYDWLGRMTSESNPETGNNGANGTITYVYDSSANCGGVPVLGCGDLASRTDNAGNKTNYTYDALHRLLTAGNSNISGATLKNFFYDSKGSYPSGVSVSNGKSRLVEAQTTNSSNAPITDEFFSYDNDGRLTDVYESTPHSGGYYHTTANYWPTGALETLSGIPGVPTIYYGTNASSANYLDGEGRYTGVGAASGINPVVSNVSYSANSTSNPLGALIGVTYGSSDSDSFTYDPNTGRAGTYTFTVNGKTDTGTLSWNSNGTLQQVAINDQIPGTSDTQTCTYTYDSLARVAGTSCNSSPAWAQTFSYDPFGNITKSGNGAFAPLYSFSSGAITNQFYSIPGVTVSYDQNGNLLKDNLNSYTWDPNWGNMLSVSSGSVTVNATYDALGRMVEQSSGSANSEILYSPIGKTAIMTGSTLTKAFIPLPGGGTAIYNSSGLAYYRHSDWLGSSRLTSTQARGLYSSTAYAPFGEQYASAGTADPSFTAQNSNTVANLYDFTFRQHSMSQGRWISPDPMGVGAVNPGNPQTWNRYAYVANNPLSFVDPLGLNLCHQPCSDPSYGGGDPLGGGGDDGGDGSLPAMYGNDGGGDGGFGSFGFLDGGPTLGTVNGTAVWRFYAFVWESYLNITTWGLPPESGGGGGPDFMPWDLRASVVTMLRARNDCSSWFNQGQGSAADIMSHVPILLGKASSGPRAFADADTSEDPTDPITVFPDGRFYSNSKNGILVGAVCNPILGASSCRGGFQPGSYPARMILLLHELAHKMGGLIPSDRFSTPQSEQNTQTVMSHCANTVNVNTPW